ncbi:DUF4864 domain-containing protein [Crateriforma conspicua]|uniref:DUF4864 domain-containing protein n=1 Tax=Crateriforma conspicua TaxID=2527996 RepID=A0A5C5Y4D7_9PLAN|nr:hypothetical protein [Crateriforma conspicua]TWT69828.1 hypothetical protein Pan14r_21240 [Crateriforma conspicua]
MPTDFRKVLPIGIFVGIGLIAGIGWRLIQPDPSAPTPGSKSLDLAEFEKGVQPELGPADVVAIQLESMRKGAVDPEQLKLCFAFASPSNRRLTGPFERFQRLVVEPPFAALIGHRHGLIGRPQIRGDEAMVLVSIDNADGQTRAYQFYLIRQNEPPFDGCWMTEAVTPLAVVPAGAAVEPADSDQPALSL